MSQQIGIQSFTVWTPIVYCVNPHVLVDKPKLHLLICVYTEQCTCAIFISIYQDEPILSLSPPFYHYLRLYLQYLSHIAYQTNGINGEIIIEIMFNMIFTTKHSYTLKYVNILTIQGHSKFAKEKLMNVYWRYQMWILTFSRPKNRENEL